MTVSFSRRELFFSLVIGLVAQSLAPHLVVAQADGGVVAASDPAPTEADVERCYRAVTQALRPIARVEVTARARDPVLFGMIARVRCPGWDDVLRELARLVVRRDLASHRRLLALLVDHTDPRCNALGSAPGRCSPHHVLVRGVDASQGPDGIEAHERLVLVRAVDALSARPELLPLAQLVWGFGDYDGRCETWDMATMHDDVRRGHVRRQLYRAPPGHTREELAARDERRGGSATPTQ